MNLLHLAQIVASIILIVLILIQERSSGLSGIFGGGSDGGSYQTRRGLERVLFWATVGTAAAFAALALLDFILPNAS